MKRILIYSNGDTFGDALLKLPAIGGLRRALPDARLVWLAGRGPTLYASTFTYSANRWLDEVIDHAGVGERWTELIGRRPLHGREFDIVIDTQQYLRTTLILRRVRHRVFVSAAAGFRLSDLRPPGGHRPGHVQDRLLQLFSMATGQEVAPIHRIPVPESATTLAMKLLPPGPTYVGLAPGAGGREKIWPLDGFLEVGRRLLATGRVPVFLLGPDERALIPSIREALPQARFPEWEVGKEQRGPYLVMALAARLQAAVANDSGTGHMLAAGGAPLVSLFGPSDPGKFAPRACRSRILRATEFGSPRMDAIPPEAVFKALESLCEPDPRCASS